MQFVDSVTLTSREPLPVASEGGIGNGPASLWLGSETAIGTGCWLPGTTAGVKPKPSARLLLKSGCSCVPAPIAFTHASELGCTGSESMREFQ